MKLIKIAFFGRLLIPYLFTLNIVFFTQNFDETPANAFHVRPHLHISVFMFYMVTLKT